jgi:hypothetical protein
MRGSEGEGGKKGGTQETKEIVERDEEEANDGPKRSGCRADTGEGKGGEQGRIAQRESEGTEVQRLSRMDGAWWRGEMRGKEAYLEHWQGYH